MHLTEIDVRCLDRLLHYRVLNITGHKLGKHAAYNSHTRTIEEIAAAARHDGGHLAERDDSRGAALTMFPWFDAQRGWRIECPSPNIACLATCSGSREQKDFTTSAHIRANSNIVLVPSSHEGQPDAR